MKPFASLFGLLTLLFAGCATVTDAKRPPTIGAWSDAVDAIRGRLVVESTLDEEGFPQATIYLELQNLAHIRQLVFTRGTECFTWKLTDAAHELLPRWKGSLPWVYDLSQLSYPLTLPFGATLRMPVSDATYHVFVRKSSEPEDRGGSSLVLEQDAPNPPWHLTSGRSTESYFLSGTFKSARESDAPSVSFWWHGQLLLPAVRLPSDPSPRRDIASAVEFGQEIP